MRIGVRFSAKTAFSVPLGMQTTYEVHTYYCLCVMGVGLKQSKREADNSSETSVKVKNAWICGIVICGLLKETVRVRDNITSNGLLTLNNKPVFGERFLALLRGNLGICFAGNE
jgi:hypothetical protein